MKIGEKYYEKIEDIWYEKVKTYHSIRPIYGMELKEHVEEITEMMEELSKKYDEILIEEQWYGGETDYVLVGYVKTENQEEIEQASQEQAEKWERDRLSQLEKETTVLKEKLEKEGLLK